MGLCNYLKEYGTPPPPRYAPFDQPKTVNGHGTHTSKAVQTSQRYVNVLIIDNFIFTPFPSEQITINHIDCNVGLEGTKPRLS